MENKGKDNKKDNKTENKREEIQTLFASISEPYRIIAMEKALEIMSDNIRSDQEKRRDTQRLFEQTKAVNAYISDIERGLKTIIQEVDGSQRNLQTFEILGKREYVEQFKLDIQQTRRFIEQTNKTIDEIIKNIDLEGARRLLDKVENKRKESELILSRVQGSRRVKRFLKDEKRYKLNEQTKKIMKRFGVASLAALMGLYITTGIKNKVSSVDLEDDYENEITVDGIIESGDLKDIFKIISQGQYRNNDDFKVAYEEFQEDFEGLAEAIENFSKYDEKKNLKSDERSKFYKSALEILNYPNFNETMIKLIKAKIASGVIKSGVKFDEKEYENNILLGKYIEPEIDGFRENYKFIEYKISDKEKSSIKNTDQFTIGLFSKDKNGRMSAEFVDIVDIYLELLSNQEMSEEKRTEIFQAVAAFLDKEIEIEQSKPCKGKLQISDREEESGGR